MKTILFQGDSITDMMRDADWEENRGIGYPTMVAGSLGAERPGAFRFLNRGVSGNRAIDILARVKADIINLKPDYLSILVGINDVWRKYDQHTGMDVYWYETYYDLLLRQIRDELPHIRIMILEPFILKGSATEPYWEDFRADTEAHAAVARRIAEKYHLVFIPLQQEFDRAAEQAPGDYWLFDGVHPTAMGHEIIKRAWLKGFAALEKQDTERERIIHGRTTTY